MTQHTDEGKGKRKKSKFFKRLLTFIVLIGILGLGAFAYFFLFHDNHSGSGLHLIPKDAIYIVDCPNIQTAWEEVNDNEIWSYLQQHGHYEKIDQQMQYIDSLMEAYPMIEKALKGRGMMMSAHMITKDDYDYLFVLELSKATKFALFQQTFITAMEASGYHVEKADYSNNNIYTVKIDKETTYFMSFVDGYICMSETVDILKNAIDAEQLHYWDKNEDFKKIIAKQRKNRIKFYMNFEFVDEFSKCYLKDDNPIIKEMSESFEFNSMGVYIKEGILNMDGYISMNDSVKNLFTLLSTVEPAKTMGYRIVSDKAAFYMSLCFNSFDEFYSQLTDDLKKFDSVGYNDYEKYRKMTEKVFHIDFDEHLFSWIGNEIAVVKLQPNVDIKENDLILMVHANDIQKAKDGLGFIMKKASRTMLKLKNFDHHGVEIYYINIKGFLKPFIGKYFKDVDLPYYTFIDDYVLFSNSPTCLINSIDDFMKEQCLAQSESFMEFRDNFERESNVSLWVQMPKLYSHLYYFGNNAKKKDYRKNKETILSFKYIGFEIIGNQNYYEMNIKAMHDPDAAFDESIEQFEKTADDINNVYYENLLCKINLKETELENNTYLRSYYKEDLLKAEGLIEGNEMNGEWKTYTTEGFLSSVQQYEDGKLSGESVFYYPSEKQNVKSRVTFDEDEIVDYYQEYYKNGILKAKISYRKGKAHGDAEFYYKSGNIKIKGDFKKGEKQGKWKYFVESGEVYNKEKWNKKKKK